MQNKNIIIQKDRRIAGLFLIQTKSKPLILLFFLVTIDILYRINIKTSLYFSCMAMTTTERDFVRTITRCWSRETAMDPHNRSEQNPSYSQCLATALVARDEL